MQSMSDQGLAHLLGAIAGDTPAPGAGAAAAISLALGIACARKAVGITLRHHPEHAQPGGLEARLADLAEQALPLGDEDAALFAASLSGGVDAIALQTFGQKAVAISQSAQDAIAEARSATHAPLLGDIVAAEALVATAATIFRSNLAEVAD